MATDAAVANAAAQSAKIAHSASTGAAVFVAAEAAWTAVKTDAENSLDGVLPNSIPLWPIQAHPLKPEWKGIRRRVQSQSDAADWQFWIDWYDSLLDGRPMLGDAGRTWEMLERIALIDPEIWDKGPEVVNPMIREIWESYVEDGLYSGSSADPKLVSEDAKSAMKQRVVVNRDALTVAGAGLMDQLAAFRDRVRGMNHLESEYARGGPRIH